jgi:hypothetical protein
MAVTQRMVMLLAILSAMLQRVNAFVPSAWPQV